MMQQPVTIEIIQQALKISPFDHATAWKRMAPSLRTNTTPRWKRSSVRPAGVLILLYPVNDNLHFLLTRRTENVATHKGQISFPGGAQDPGDGSPRETALRETCEEVGVCIDNVRILGTLTPLYVEVSDFEIHPYVGYLPESPTTMPQPDEVAEVLEMSIEQLMDNSLKTSEVWDFRGLKMDVPFYRLNGHIIWGATAIILSELENRLRQSLNGDQPNL